MGRQDYPYGWDKGMITADEVSVDTGTFTVLSSTDYTVQKALESIETFLGTTIPGTYVPYTGATTDVDLGAYALYCEDFRVGPATTTTSKPSISYTPMVVTSYSYPALEGKATTPGGDSSALVLKQKFLYIVPGEGETAGYIHLRGNTLSVTERWTIDWGATTDSLIFNHSGKTNPTIDFSDIDLTTTGYTSTKNFTTSAHYTGFPNRTDTTLSFNDGTATLSLTCTNKTIWINGVEYTISTLTKAFTDGTAEASGLYWFWITAPGGVPQLNYGTSVTNQFAQCLVATVYWNTTTNLGILSDERHWMGRDQWMHEYLHETVGARYYIGLTGTFGNTTFSITAGEFYDEDIEHVLSSDSPMAYPGTAMTTCKVLYHNGDADWAWDSASTTPYKITTGNLRFNTGNTLSTAGANKFVNYWVFASAGTVEPIWVVVGTAEYNNIADARAATVPSLGTLPSAEIKLIYKITYKNDGTPTYQEAIDYRASEVLGSTFTPTNHATLSNLAFSTSGHTWDAAVNFNSQNLLTTGTLGAGAITGTSLSAGSGTLTAGIGTITSLNLTADSNQIVFDSDAAAGVTTTLTDSAATSGKVITLPNFTGTLYISSGTDVAVADGGTGRSSHTAYALIAGGTTTTAAQQSISNSSLTRAIVMSNGTNAVPSWSSSTYPSTVTSGYILYATSSNVVNASSSLTYISNVLTCGTVYAATKARIPMSFTVTITSTSCDWDSLTIPIWQGSKGGTITITQITSTCYGSSTPNLVFNIDERAYGSLNSAGTNLTAAAITAADTGTKTTSFTNASLAQDAHLVFKTGVSAESSGTVDFVTITVYYIAD